MSELGRTLERNQQAMLDRIADLRAQNTDLKAQNARDLQTIVERLERYVLQAVYEADKRTAEALNQAIDKRMAHVEAKAEAQQQEIAGHHRTNRLLFWTVAAAVLGGLATVITTVLMVKGGGR